MREYAYVEGLPQRWGYGRWSDGRLNSGESNYVIYKDFRYIYNQGGSGHPYKELLPIDYLP